MNDTSDKPRRGVGYAGAVLLSQLNRLLTEAEKLADAKNGFLDALSEDSHNEAREQPAHNEQATSTPQQISAR